MGGGQGVTVDAVDVIGLDAFANDVARACSDSGAINASMSQAAVGLMNPVAGATRSAVPTVSGQLGSSVRVNASRSGAAVRMGSGNVRYAGWIEFGGHRRAPHESVRDYSSFGRYLFPSARPVASRVTDVYSEAITRALDRYPWSYQG